MRRNFQDDFCFYLSMNIDGTAVDPVSIDWELDISVSHLPSSSKQKVYRASWINSVAKNCLFTEGKTLIICHSHGLPPGRLVMELKAWRKDSRYPDGVELNVTPIFPEIELTTGESDTPTNTDIDVTLPWIYISAYDQAVAAGYAGTYDDYINFIMARSIGKITLSGTDGLETSFNMFAHTEQTSYYYGDSESFVIGEFDDSQSDG